MAERNRFAFFWDCGAGKTLPQLWRWQIDPQPTLVICPKPIMRAAWEADAELIGMDQQIYILHGKTPKQKRDTRGRIDNAPPYQDV